MQSKQVVIDTNVWVSCFLKARFTDLVHLIVDNDLTVFSSEELIGEMIDVLNRKKISKYLNAPIEDYINFHRQLVSINSTRRKLV